MRFEGAIPTSRCRHTATLIGNEMIVFGGNDCDHSFNDLYSLDIDYTSWRQINIQKSEFIDNFKELLFTGEFSDVTFNVQGVLVSAHRCVLSARCLFFKDMFNDQKNEELQSEIEVQDISIEVFKSIIEYLYTDRIQLKPDMIFDLMVVADKFQLQQLKNQCESRLVKNINMDNIIDLLQYSCKHNTNQLKKCCMDFVLKNFESFIKLPNFEKLSKSIMVELLRRK